MERKYVHYYNLQENTVFLRDTIPPPTQENPSYALISFLATLSCASVITSSKFFGLRNWDHTKKLRLLGPPVCPVYNHCFVIFALGCKLLKLIQSIKKREVWRTTVKEGLNRVEGEVAYRDAPTSKKKDLWHSLNININILCVFLIILEIILQVIFVCLMPNFETSFFSEECKGYQHLPRYH